MKKYEVYTRLSLIKEISEDVFGMLKKYGLSNHTNDMYDNKVGEIQSRKVLYSVLKIIQSNILLNEHEWPNASHVKEICAQVINSKEGEIVERILLLEKELELINESYFEIKETKEDLIRFGTYKDAKETMDIYYLLKEKRDALIWQLKMEYKELVIQ